MHRIFYRYFLAFLPDLALRCELARLCEVTGQSAKRVKAEYLHLTLCVVAEIDHRNRSIAHRLNSAFAEGLPPSCPIPLGNVAGSSGGAAIHTIGNIYEIRVFYKLLVRLIANQQIFPMYRKSGLNPHVTLGYDRSEFKGFMLWEWIPAELVLIESEVGRNVHNVLRRWPLDPPRQGSLPFDSGLPLHSRPDRIAYSRHYASSPAKIRRSGPGRPIQ